MSDDGIERHFTVRETPQQNSIAERMNMILLEKVSCALSNTGISKSFRAEALAYACYLVNRLPSSAIGGKLLWKFDWEEMLRIMTHSGYLVVWSIITSKKTSYTRGREKKCVYRI